MLSVFNLQNKVVVITGGTGVLGSELSRGLARAGAKVAVLGRDAARRDRVVAEIRQEGGEAIGVLADVLNRDDLLRARNEVLAHYGTVDILVNGAGGNSKQATTSPELPLFDLLEGELDWVVRLNFMGTLLPTQMFGEVLAEKKEGVILNISSMAALQPLTNVVGYSAAKAAVNNLTQWLAVHFCQSRFGHPTHHPQSFFCRRHEDRRTFGLLLPTPSPKPPGMRRPLPLSHSSPSGTREAWAHRETREQIRHTDEEHL